MAVSCAQFAITTAIITMTPPHTRTHTHTHTHDAFSPPQPPTHTRVRAQNLGVVVRCAGWATGLPVPSAATGAGEELLLKLARLLSVLSGEIMDALKRVENGGRARLCACVRWGYWELCGRGCGSGALSLKIAHSHARAHTQTHMFASRMCGQPWCSRQEAKPKSAHTTHAPFIHPPILPCLPHRRDQLDSHGV